ncbi:MAG: hypothetical protein IKU36_02200 [Bacteroidales bacterium]|nr:hypothetical protein [Bacteroidales bacterium]
MNKSLVFTPGCDWRIDRRILFVEYETVAGEHMSKRFDLSAETEYIVDGYKTLSFDEISKPDSKLKYSIKKIVYFEKECNSMTAFVRGCKQNRLFIPTRIEFDTVIHVSKESTDVDSDVSDRVKMINQRIARDTLNSVYGIVSRDWADVLADSARYIHMTGARRSGKTLWLSSATSFDDNKQPLWNINSYHDVCEQWLKTPPGKCEFIADDLEDCEKGVPNTKLVDPQLYFQDTTTGEMKPYEGVKDITPKPMRFRGKTWTHPESSYGKKGHMLTVDISSNVRNDDYLDVEIGDAMWYDDGHDGEYEPDDHGKLFVWLGLGVGWKKLSDDNGYFDTDTVQYCLNDVAVTEKFFKEEKIMRFDSCKPTIKNVIFNDPATIIMWSDGTKTVVKCGENDIFDPEKGVAMACMKKLLGTNKTGSNYLDKVQEYFDAYDEEQIAKSIDAKQRFMKFLAGCVKNGTDSKDIPPEVTVDKEFEAVTNDDWIVVPVDENTIAEENGE